MKNITLICPAYGHKAYHIAAEVFADLAGKVSGAAVTVKMDVEFDENNINDESDFVLLGNDAVNQLTSKLFLEGYIKQANLCYGSDSYIIQTIRYKSSNILLLAGGRPRAALYAVYRYFEIFCDCHWFWDGDRMKQCELPFSDIYIKEVPRFEYRGIRYFAHRSLHRFQAEHWSFDDWKKEIHWLLKKRLNMFMLRIGMDDVYQKAFPDIVHYPERDKKLPEAGEGFDDRTLFWSLEYRGELRKKILQYAFDCDLMHPEDCGTMTHWYSRTPIEFLEKVKPTMLAGQTVGYSDKTELVWDIREEENLDNYFKLTEAHIKEYGRPELFHTIGLAERLYSDNRDVNHRLKLNTYHRIATRLAEKYPNAPLMIASWDLWMDYTAEEVQSLVSQMDPEQVIILDYTSDAVTDSNFTNWGVVGKFPWIFGMFGGFEPQNEIRGNYEWTNERLAIAKADDMCKGFILWPELSHGDTFSGEYLSYHAWESDLPSVEYMVEKYCRERYKEIDVGDMTAIWKKFMPIVSLRAWSMGKVTRCNYDDIFTDIVHRALFSTEMSDMYRKHLEAGNKWKKNAVEILNDLAFFAPKIDGGDELLYRDVFDITRTIMSRYINLGIMQCEKLYADRADINILSEMMNNTEQLLGRLADLLAIHDDYSLFVSLKELESVTDTNPNFELTLKHNAECPYCRSFIFENAKYLYVPEMKIVFDEVKRSAVWNNPIDKHGISERVEKNREAYYQLSLENMNKQPKPDLCKVLKESSYIVAQMKF